MTHGIDSPLIDLVVLLQALEDGVKELQIAIALHTFDVLPAVLCSLWIDQDAGRRQALHVHHDRFGPFSVHVE
jgi:hypothetical protein